MYRDYRFFARFLMSSAIEGFYIFSKGGFTDGLLQAQERGEVQLLTLADIFEYQTRKDTTALR